MDCPSGTGADVRTAPRSAALYERACRLLPGGVSSPVRAFGHVGGTPVFMRSGQGAEVVDEDGARYVDFCLAWGPLVLGHAHPAVVEATSRALRDGLAFGTCHRFEGDLGERVLAAFPYADAVRFVVSGTEAVLSAMRLARAHTKRNVLVKFSGCYHGHVDALLVRAGSGVATQGLADSDGVGAAVAADTIVLPLDDEEALETAFAKHGERIAAVVLEPLPANNGLLEQRVAWLARIRELASEYGSVLVFDEVITGFRFGFHGYARLVGIEPDLTTLGKIVGGGLPVGAVLGRREIMERLAPLGAVYQAGTMAGNPVALAAGIATLDVLATDDAYARLDALGAHLDQAALAAGVRIARVGSIFWPYLDATGELPRTATSISPQAVARFRAAYHGWLGQGIYLPPSAYEVGFLSLAHERSHVDRLVSALASG